MVELAGLCVLASFGAAIMLMWGLLMWTLWSRLALVIWRLSYPLDAWIERMLDVPEEHRRFS